MRTRARFLVLLAGLCLILLSRPVNPAPAPETGLIEVRYNGRSAVCEFDPENERIRGIGELLGIPTRDLALPDLRKICRVHLDERNLTLHVYDCLFERRRRLELPEDLPGIFVEEGFFDLKGITYSGSFFHVRDEGTGFRNTRPQSSLLAEFGFDRPLNLEGELFYGSDPERLSFSLLRRFGNLSLLAGRIPDEEFFFDGVAVRYATRKREGVELRVLSRAGCTADLLVNGLYYRTYRIDRDLFHIRAPVVAALNRYELVLYCPEGITRKTYRYEKRDRVLTRGEKDLFLGRDDKGRSFLRLGYGVSSRFSLRYTKRPGEGRFSTVLSLGGRLFDLSLYPHEDDYLGLSVSGDTFLFRIRGGERLTSYEVDRRWEPFGGIRLALRATERETELGLFRTGLLFGRVSSFGVSLAVDPLIRTERDPLDLPALRLFSRIPLARGLDVFALFRQKERASLEIERHLPGTGRLTLSYERDLRRDLDEWSLGFDLTERRALTLFLRGTYSPGGTSTVFAGLRGFIRRGRRTYLTRNLSGRGCLEIVSDLSGPFEVTIRSWQGFSLLTRTVRGAELIPLKPDESYLVEVREAVVDGRPFLPRKRRYRIHTHFHFCNRIRVDFVPVTEVSGRTEKQWGRLRLFCTCETGESFERETRVFMGSWSVLVPQGCRCEPRS